MIAVPVTTSSKATDLELLLPRTVIGEQLRGVKIHNIHIFIFILAQVFIKNMQFRKRI